ncbi:Isochorismatase-like protein [Hygrophoropsis aurantiaca]|uniref:Isochorismatase-like protein n=1 Tax=Hygrophoropsis aurantiaca TaxID=72124 RepID=A0ACB8ARS8_9AGAM|nr:Isochorismatase-like protein [Hygrophoropsis aurantiaca]
MATESFVPALVVVDMQNDFVTGSLAVPDATKTIEPINFLLTLDFKLKIGTQDWHPRNHVSFANNHSGKNQFEKTTIFPPTKFLNSSIHNAKDMALEQVLWPDHCVADTRGAQFVPDLDVKRLQNIITKGKEEGLECYSAFCDVWGLTRTELATVLQNNGVTDVFLVGVAGDYCVKFTAIDAVKHGFKAWVVKDAVRSVSQDGSEWHEMQTEGVMFIEKSEEVAQILKHRI